METSGKIGSYVELRAGVRCDQRIVYSFKKLEHVDNSPIAMKRYRSNHSRTEEEKRNLKVDLKRIPEWEAEINLFALVLGVSVCLKYLRQHP